MNSPAAKIVAGIHNLSLVEQMAFALKQVSYLDNYEARFAAYYRTGCDLFAVSVDEQKAADTQALSIELARRIEGRQ